VTLASRKQPEAPFTNGLHRPNRENTPLNDDWGRPPAAEPAHGRTEEMTQTVTKTTRVLLATFAGALVLLVAGIGNATAAPAASQEATPKCWLQVINDWLAHQPNLTGTYAIPCYTQAIQHLSQYPDVAGYSSAEDDIHNALLAAIRQDRGGGGPTSGSGGGGHSGGGGGGVSGSGGGGGTSGGGVVGTGIDKIGPSNAQSIPLPLIVLAGLALLLLLTAGGTWLARRIQTRRMPPAAPVRRP
jgi:hypothetical protein